jgi:hypothetical protein
MEVRSAVVSELHRCHAVADAAGAETVASEPARRSSRTPRSRVRCREIATNDSGVTAGR